jgi:signal peptidase II
MLQKNTTASTSSLRSTSNASASQKRHYTGVIFSFVIILLFYSLDQFTKWLILRRIELNDSRTVISGFFDLVHVHNTGAAFGSFHNSNTGFTVLSLVTLCVLAVCAWRGAFHGRWTKLGVALLTAGVLGNLTDRLLHKHVIDFLDFYIGEHHWPAFNVADSCICVAAAIFILSSFRESKAPASQVHEDSANSSS